MAHMYLLEDPKALEKQVYSARSCWEQYLIREDSLKNRSEGGRITGYDFAIRTCWYRSLAITLIRRLEVRVDGEIIPPEQFRFEVEGSGKAYRLDEIGPEQAEEFWFLNKFGYIHVDKPGGLKAGPHDIEVVLEVFVTYHNYPDCTYQKRVVTLSE